MSVLQMLKHKGREVVTARANERVGEAARVLAARNIGAVVVTDASGAVAGILSERDIVRAVAEQGARALERPVSEIMTRDVEVCGPQDSVDDLMERMTHGRYRHMPVVENGRLTGIVSIGDVVKQRIAQSEFEVQAMSAYIATAG